MATDRPAPQPVTWRGGPPHRPGPQLPAFCRSRRPPVLITLANLSSLRLLLLAGLLLQITTLLLLLTRPPAKAQLAPRQATAQARKASSPTTGTASAASTSAQRPPLLGR